MWSNVRDTAFKSLGGFVKGLINNTYSSSNEECDQEGTGDLEEGGMSLRGQIPDDEETQSLPMPEQGTESSEDGLFGTCDNGGFGISSAKGSNSSGSSEFVPEGNGIASGNGSGTHAASTSDNDVTNRRQQLISTPTRGLLKRRIHDVDSEDSGSAAKKKRSVGFNGVTVFYFPRTQGFSCVPSQGGSTLGMGLQHTQVQNFTMGEHACEQKRQHRLALLRLQQQQQQQQQQQNEAGSQSPTSVPPITHQDNMPSQPQPVPNLSDESDSPDEVSNPEMDSELDSYYFLQPVPTRQRRVLLREAGVDKIDSVEKEECRDIRTSRESCGCSCKTYCDPDSCSCAQAGIKCQVDRLNFPCGCTRDGCANVNGRIEFNPVRVRTHFVHTLTKMELEKKQMEEEQGHKIPLWSPSMSKSKTGLSVETFSHSMKPESDSCGLPSSSSVGSNGKLSLSDAQPWASLIAASSSSFKDDDDEMESSEYNLNLSLMKDVSFSSTIELEACVNSGSHTNVHQESKEVQSRLRVGNSVVKDKVPPMALHSMEEQTSRDGPGDRALDEQLDMKIFNSGLPVISSVVDDETVFTSIENARKDEKSLPPAVNGAKCRKYSVNNSHSIKLSADKLGLKNSNHPGNGSFKVGDGGDTKSGAGNSWQSQSVRNHQKHVLSTMSSSPANFHSEKRPARRYTLKSGRCIDFEIQSDDSRSCDSPPGLEPVGNNKIKMSSYDLRRGSRDEITISSLINRRDDSAQSSSCNKRVQSIMEESTKTNHNEIQMDITKNLKECKESNGISQSRPKDHPQDKFSSMMKKTIVETVSA